MSGEGASDCVCLRDILPNGTALSRPVYQTGLPAAGRAKVSDPAGTIKIISIWIVHKKLTITKVGVLFEIIFWFASV